MSPMNDASVRDRAKNLARKTVVSPQAILQMHLLERLLARIAKSAYADKVVLNGRARDFYDAVLMLRLYADTLGWKQLGDAIRATASRRGSESALATWRKTLERVHTSPYIQEAIWAPYAKANPYAAGITIDDAIDVCIAMGERTLS